MAQRLCSRAVIGRSGIMIKICLTFLALAGGWAAVSHIEAEDFSTTASEKHFLAPEDKTMLENFNDLLVGDPVQLSKIFVNFFLKHPLWKISRSISKFYPKLHWQKRCKKSSMLPMQPS